MTTLVEIWSFCLRTLLSLAWWKEKGWIVGVFVFFFFVWIFVRKAKNPVVVTLEKLEKRRKEDQKKIEKVEQDKRSRLRDILTKVLKEKQDAKEDFKEDLAKV